MENVTKMKGQTADGTNQTSLTDNGTTSRNDFAVKTNYSDVKLKELFAEPKMQEAMRLYISVPETVTVKKLRNPFEDKETKTTTQKIEAMSGTTIEDAVSLELTLLNTELDPVEAVNKKYRIVDYTFALDANMSGGRFGGYAAKGLKLMVTRLDEVKGDEK